MTKIPNNREEIVFYEAEDGQLSFNVNIFADTVWLSQ